MCYVELDSLVYLDKLLYADDSFLYRFRGTHVDDLEVPLLDRLNSLCLLSLGSSKFDRSLYSCLFLSTIAPSCRKVGRWGIPVMLSKDLSEHRRGHSLAKLDSGLHMECSGLSLLHLGDKGSRSGELGSRLVVL